MRLVCIGEFAILQLDNSVCHGYRVWSVRDHDSRQPKFPNRFIDVLFIPDI